MRRVVLACETVQVELRRLLPPETEFRVVEQGLHRTPERLREALQLEIDSIDADEIVLGYGLCGNGVVGLSSRMARLIIPRVDDCIAILLGSAERYQEEFHRVPGTYWLSHGWIEHSQTDPYREYQRCREKYGEETAQWVAGEMMKGYRRMVLIDTGAGDMDQLRAYAREFADFFGLEYLEMQGTDDLAKSLLSQSEWGDEFVVVQPGEKVRTDLFLPSNGLVNG